MTEQKDLSKQLVLGEIARKWAHKIPDKEAFVIGDKRYSFSQFNERVNRLANALSKTGIKKGDKISLLFMNSVEILECYFAAGKIGAIAVPNNFRLAPDEYIYQINQSDSIAFIFQEVFYELVDKIRPQLTSVKYFICVSEKETTACLNYEKILADSSSEEPGIFVSDEEPLYIMYTAGTTGRPKGILITHKNVVIDRINLSLELGLSFNERALCVPPLFHTGAACECTTFFYLGCTTVILERFELEKILPLIEKEKITLILLMPVMWSFLLSLPDIDKYDTNSLKFAVTGASIMPVELKEKVIKKFPNAGVFDLYGLTECTTNATIIKPEDAYRKPGSIGKAMINIETGVVDSDGNSLPPGEAGELILNGPTIMKGVYNNPKATEDAIKDGWLYTGDVVKMDEEGYLYILDRKKDMIISGGENIYPAEVEAVLVKHPKIREVAVIGVPDSTWGENVLAVVVLNEGETATEEEIIEYCKAHIASYKKPKSVIFEKELPRNPSGKVLKTELRKKYGASFTDH